MQPIILTSKTPEAVWLNANPSFQWLHRRLLGCLARDHTVACWEYSQTPDEPASLDVALTLLHDYVKTLDRPIHLLGHSTGGLLGFLYAQRHPERVRSLGLLSIGANPSIDWQAHYYTLLELLPCSRERILGQMVHLIFGHQPWPNIKYWIEMLEQDLLYAPSPHSPLKRASISASGVEVPLLICGGEDDLVVDLTQLQAWKPLLKNGDRLWKFPQGDHFFHADHPKIVAEQIRNFWGDRGPGCEALVTVRQESAM